MLQLTENDLLAIISKDELDGLAREAVEDGQEDPIATAIADALGTIGMYADPRKIPDDALKRVWRVLAVCWIYNRLATMPEKREKEQKWALGVLEQIRDGKFQYLAVDETKVPADGGGRWGSKKKFNTR